MVVFLLIIGAGYALWGVWLAISDLRVFKRRSVAQKTCVGHDRDRYGAVIQKFQMGTGELGELRSRNVVVQIGETVAVAYDPKRQHTVYLASENPRFEHGKAALSGVVVGGVVALAALILAVL